MCVATCFHEILQKEQVPRCARDDRFFYKPFPAMNVIRSRTRQEYPHSLSYHAITFTQLPATTSVIGESTMDEKELPLKSEETSSCVSYPRYGARGPLCDAFCNAPFTSSTVVALST